MEDLMTLINNHSPLLIFGVGCAMISVGMFMLGTMHSMRKWGERW